MSKQANIKKFLDANQRLAAVQRSTEAAEHGSVWGKIGVIGGAVTAVGAVVATAFSFWTTNNMQDEATKEKPWLKPNYTTVLVTKAGGFVSSFFDDGKQENGHDYVNGIYNLWKASDKGQKLWAEITADPAKIDKLPPLWKQEFNKDKTIKAETTESVNKGTEADNEAKRLRAAADAASAAQSQQTMNMAIVDSINNSGTVLGLQAEAKAFKEYYPSTLAKRFNELGLIPGATPAKVKQLETEFKLVALEAKKDRLGPQELATITKTPSVNNMIDQARNPEFVAEVKMLALGLVK